MPDREKVIKGKEHLDVIMEIATHFSYPDYGIVQDHCLAILDLLKEQEPKPVRIDEDSVHCPSCGNELFTYPRQKFCDECGQELMWDD